MIVDSMLNGIRMLLVATPAASASMKSADVPPVGLEQHFSKVGQYISVSLNSARDEIAREKARQLELELPH